jgi:DNA polymerase III subunit beta
MQKIFVLDHRMLGAALSTLQPICTRRTTLTATSGILFQCGVREVVIKSTDLEVSFQTSIPLLENMGNHTVEFVASGKRLHDIIKDIEAPVQLAIQDQVVQITAGSLAVTLHTQDPQEFPPMPERIENICSIDARLLMDLLDAVLFLVPQNNANPGLNGLYIQLGAQGLRMTATDGHSLALAETSLVTLATQQSWLVPRRAVFELKKILADLQEHIVFLGTCGSQLVFSGQRFNFFTKLLQHKFPQYEQALVREGFHAATLDRSTFMRALKRSTSLLTGQFLATQFTFAPHELRMSLSNKEVGELHDRVALRNYDHESMQMRFYAPYVLAGLQAFDEEVQFFVGSAQKPIIFESCNDRLRKTYLVMPVSRHAA